MRGSFWELTGRGIVGESVRRIEVMFPVLRQIRVVSKREVLWEGKAIGTFFPCQGDRLMTWRGGARWALVCRRGWVTSPLQELQHRLVIDECKAGVDKFTLPREYPIATAPLQVPSAVVELFELYIEQ